MANGTVMEIAGAQVFVPDPIELPWVKLIPSWQSQLIGFGQNLLAGTAAAALATGVLRFFFPDLSLTDYLMSPIAWGAGLSVVLLEYQKGVMTIDVNRRGIPLFLGEPQTNLLLRNGKHFLFRPLMSGIDVPGSSEIFTYTVKIDEPAAKDKIRVIIGETRRAVIIYRVADPFRYIRATSTDGKSEGKDPGIALEGIFLDRARKFINQLNYAVGIIDEKAILDNFLELPPLKVGDDPIFTESGWTDERARQVHFEFEQRLLDLKVSLEGRGDRLEVFDTESVNTIMDRYAGKFREEAALLGIEIVNVLSPSLELPEEIQFAAEEKQIQHERNQALASRMETVIDQAAKLASKKELAGVNPSDALDRVGLASKQNVTRTIWGFPDLPEAVERGLKALGAGIAAARGTNQDQPK